MSNIKIGLKAHLRFPYTNGNRTIEELMDFGSEQLLMVGQPLEEEVSKFNGGSFFKSTKKTKKQSQLELMLNIVKELYEDKVKEEELANSLSSLSREEQELMAIAAMQEKDSLRNSPELVKQRLAEIAAKKALLK